VTVSAVCAPPPPAAGDAVDEGIEEDLDD